MERMKNIPLLPLLSYLLYILLWGAGRYLYGELEEFSTILATVVFYLVAIIPFGVVVALKAAKKTGFKLHEPRNRTELGIGVLIFVLILFLSAFAANVYETITDNPAVLEELLRSSLMVLPFSLGVSLNILFLVPRAIQTHLDRGFVSVVVTAMACGLAMGVGWMFDSLFEDFDAVMIMTISGIMFGFGAALTRSLYINFASFSIFLLIINLMMGGGIEEPFLGTLIGFVLTGAILVLSVAKGRGYL